MSVPALTSSEPAVFDADPVDDEESEFPPHAASRSPNMTIAPAPPAARSASRRVSILIAAVATSPSGEDRRGSECLIGPLLFLHRGLPTICRQNRMPCC